MALGSNIKYQIQAVFGAAFDEKSAKQVEQMYDKMTQRVTESTREEFVSAFKDFGTILNNALQKLNIQPIDIDKLVELPNAQMFSQLGSELGSKFVDGFKNSTSNGDLSDGIVDDLSKRLEELTQKRKQLMKDYEDAQKNLKNKTRIEKLNEFDPFDAKPLKINGDIEKEAKNLLDVLYKYSAKIQKLQDEGKEETREYSAP